MSDHQFIPDADGGFQVDSCIDCGKPRREHGEQRTSNPQCEHGNDPDMCAACDGVGAQRTSNLVVDLYAQDHHSNTGPQLERDRLFYRAAREIERLTAELVVVNKLYEESCNQSYEYGAMREERDRLRAALESINRKTRDHSDEANRLLSEIQFIARKALAGAAE